MTTATALPTRKRQTSREIVIRPARAEEARQIHRLIESHLEEGHLLPRELDELTRHVGRFLVAIHRNLIVACGELAPLSGTLAEIRSLVVDRNHRGFGIGRHVAGALREEARRQFFDRLCAFTHQPAYFVSLGFSIVPHAWLREKISTDCSSCTLFRRCGQFAMLDDLDPVRDYRVQGLTVHA
jgi:amino-acid N-acetyltransferase